MGVSAKWRRRRSYCKKIIVYSRRNTIGSLVYFHAEKQLKSEELATREKQQFIDFLASP